jgi:formate hydrogenlyase subunit 3/multisubunit Na+/H+ antiporter MnhD subunit
VGMSPARASRVALFVRGGTGLAGMVVIAAVPSLDLVVLALLGLAVLHAGLKGKRDFASRLQMPVVAVVLIALALLFARVQGPELLQRLAAVGLVAGLAASVGLLPYVHVLEPEDAATVSPIVWIGFVGPVMATALLIRVRDLLLPDAGGDLGVMLIGLGLVNMLWGTLAAWRTENATRAWHYSFMADWGLALCGFGLTIADGQAAALLILFSIVLGRLPFYLASRQALRENASADQPINLMVAAVLAGSAPFAGFAARVLILRGATQMYWPLALVLAAGMLLWLPVSLRLGRTLGQPRGRQALGVGIVLAVNAIVGLYPLPLLSLAGR